MQNEFSNLEWAVLRWVQDHYSNQILSAQIASASFVRREWTGKGFFVYLEVAKGMKELDISDFGGAWPISGPQIKSPAVENGGGAILWGKAGFLDCIEMYAYGSSFAEHVNDFELLTWCRP